MIQVFVSFALFVFLISREIAFYSAVFWSMIIILVMLKLLQTATGTEFFNTNEHFSDNNTLRIPLPNLNNISKSIKSGELFSQDVKKPAYSIKNKCKFINSANMGTCNARFPVYSGASFGSSDKSLNCNGTKPNNVTAKAAAKINDGMISEVIVVDPGNNYNKSPTVTITGGGGKGSTCVARVKNNKISQIDITNPGSNYTSSPDVIISDPDGVNYCNFCCKLE